MTLKLRLNREARSRRVDLFQHHREFGLCIVDETCKDQPGLAVEKALNMMEEFGF